MAEKKSRKFTKDELAKLKDPAYYLAMKAASAVTKRTRRVAKNPNQ